MEVWDIYDHKRQLTGKTIERGDHLKGDEYHLAVHVWIMNDAGQFLIQKRSANLTRKPGLWAATGGAALTGEESIHAAKRELLEELSIDARSDELKLIKSFTRISNHTDVYFLRSNVTIDTLTLQEEEVDDVRWLTISEIKYMIKNDEFYHHGQSYMNQVYDYSYRQRLISHLSIKTKRLELIACDYEMVCDLYYSDDMNTRLFGFDINEETYNKLKKIIPIFKNLMETTGDKECWYIWIIVNTKFKCVVGDIGFKGAPDTASTVEIGYAISSMFRNSGFATEAVEYLINWAFEQATINRVVAVCKENNLESINVLEKNNMLVEEIRNNYIRWYRTE